MSTRSRIPPLLDTYIRLPPEASLLLLTGVVNITPHWIVTRFLSQFLGQQATTRRSENDEAIDANGEDEQDVSVVLVSWMRDFEFWKTEARRGAAIDLTRLCAEKRFAFIDGLSNLFGESTARVSSAKTSSPQKAPAPSRPNPIPHRGPLPAWTAPSRGPTEPTIPDQPKSTSASSSISPLTSSSLSTTLATITSAISSLRSPTFLILDSPTLLLATSPSVTPTDLSSFVLSLRSQVHSTLIASEADAPFLAAAAPNAFFGNGDYLTGAKEGGEKGHVTPLEANHAAFLVGQAHQARWVMGVRGLETGGARDVSGVLAVRRGGAWGGDGGEERAEKRVGGIGNGGDGDGEEMEVLFRVGMDGGVKVFARGAGDVG
ncbi:hypothetical protein CAC42_4390 [Sphaceloma murrayae]|uniref:Elongator complex protein 6 n=1 Tax=Sphaceloma murrayae TaxID=2082308 RepID=A0A2K1QM90_9PEZI|nr:hypothetical protein CAC42_4390 [Sphaceloma murrayae]